MSMYIQCKCFSSLHFSHVSNSCLENLHLLAGGEKHLLPTYLMINHDLLNCQRGHCYKMFSPIEKNHTKKSYFYKYESVWECAANYRQCRVSRHPKASFHLWGNDKKKLGTPKNFLLNFQALNLCGASKKVRSLQNVQQIIRILFLLYL